MGKDERISDILCLNPSISRQHAVIQFRLISKMSIEGEYIESIRPYVMDLGSTNGTFLNDEQIESSRYYELLHKDVLRLGHSDRLYVLVKDEGAVRHTE
jgi:pSer/pThr/pTyr-binding forkhead associated (FHA) protein